ERRERAVGTEGIVLARTLVLVGVLVPLRVEGRRHLGDDADVDHRRAVLLHHGAEVRERHGGSGRAGRRRDRARARGCGGGHRGGGGRRGGGGGRDRAA